MPVSPYTKVSSASLAGLITDGNAILATDQSNLDEQNYEILRDGTRRRRRPIVQETDGIQTFLGSSKGEQRSSYLWQTPAFRDNLSILCEESNGEVRFYTVDHDSPQYLRGPELSQDRLRLELWGTRTVDYTPDITVPCTYTEGNGSLYVFNPLTGTIRVELLEDDRLRMSAIGIWVRDYRGAAEDQAADFRKPRVEPINSYSPTIGFINPDEEVKITSELGEERAYNLSNSGWDAKSISEFMTQSDQDYTVRDPTQTYIRPDSVLRTETVSYLSSNNTVTKIYNVIDNPSIWPALTDKYLAGRQIDDKGIDQFSFPQLIQAKDNKNMPPLGARINTSEYGPGGTLVGLPTDKASTATVIPSTTFLQFIDITFDSRQTHRNASIGDYGVFVHAMSFTVEQDGRTYQGGASSMFPNAVMLDDGMTLRIRHSNEAFPEYSNFTLQELYVHPSPEYFPHYIPDNGNGFNYLRGGRRPLAGAFYAGRLWQTADNHNRVYYSQIVETSTGQSAKRGVNKESLCFASADPTDGDDNSVVPSDGGYINTNDSGTHYGLVTLGDSLLLMTDRGVWAIRPGSTGVFTASNYTFTKVMGAQVLGTKAFVSTGDAVHVATDEGILVLTMQSSSFGNTSVVVARPLDRKLMQGYEDIVSAWPNPVGTYDPESRVIRWLFRPKSDNWPAIGQPILSYSMYHDAWYKYVLGADSRVFDILVLPYTATTTTYNKFRYLIGTEKESDPNVYLTGWGVEVDFFPDGQGNWVQNGIEQEERFADYRIRTQDSFPRVSVPAFMETNHMLPGEGIKWSQINYIAVMNRNVTERWIPAAGGVVNPSVDGGTLLSVKWDWMDQNSTGKWSTPYQTYKYRRSYLPSGLNEANTYGEPVLVHKMKLRGRGREFRLFFESDGHKDSHIEGWTYHGYILNEV